ncbi:hypothetical protein INT47_012030 [Mucor saturninus]|uniref:Vacuole membrane protein 1 n=1 Tax=Mucor saturninus TaxID=64648 RepID=A0A8H7UR51_9FUNG|nr:hypothetical protein INT47_012030 [Mucor saturninus]
MTIKLHTHPLLVLSSFTKFVIEETRDGTGYLLQEHLTLSMFFAFCLAFLAIINEIKGPHQIVLEMIQQQCVWYGTWFLLGVASSIAVGTGFHTFVLFLGPYIAEVTLAANACHSAQLLTRNPDSFRLIDCIGENHFSSFVTVWAVFRQVHWESFAWGAGTAFGELPPYFIARAVAESGEKVHEKDNVVLQMIQKLGFFGIFLFASVPNPLFDLAGITCGHFKIPFSTFFGATFLGKACVKASIQSLLVILVFSHDTLNTVLQFIQPVIPDSVYQSIQLIDQTNLFISNEQVVM